MNDKTKAQLIQELKRARQRITELETELDARDQVSADQREALTQSENRFRDLAELLPETVFEANVDMMLTFVNRRALEQFGYSKQDFEQGVNALDVLIPEDHPRAVENITQVLNGEDIGIVEYTAVRKNGSTFPILIHSTPIYRNGALVGLRGIIIDNTERQQAEQALRETHAQLQATLNALPDMLFEVNRQGRIYDFHAPDPEKLHVPPQEFVNQPVSQILPPNASRAIMDAIKQAAKTGHHIGTTYTLDTPEGQHWFELSIATKGDLSAPEGRLIGLVRDITERTRTRQLLQALNQAALAMGNALTPTKILNAVTDTLRKLGFSCMILPLDETGTKLSTQYLGVDMPLVKTAEKLVGVSHQDYSFRVADVAFYQRVLEERVTLFTTDVTTIMRHVVPKFARPLAKQLVKLMSFEKLIAAPLIVADQTVGVLSIQASDLTKHDVPAFTAFAHQVAAAWHKARLFEQATQAENRMRQALAAQEEALAETLQATHALRQREEKYRLLAENTSDIVWMMDLTGQFTYVSPSIKRHFGFTPEEIVGMTIEQCLTPESAARAVKLLREQLTLPLAERARAVTAKFQQWTKDGTTVDIEITANWQIDPETGNPTAIQGITRNITERKQAEAALKESQRRLRLFIDASPDLYFLKDKSLRYLLLNTANAKFFGQPEADLIGKTDFDLMPEEAARGCWETDRQAMQECKPVLSVEQIGDRVYETRKLPVIIDGDVMGVAGIIRDITERTRMEEQLRRQEQLAAIGQLAAGIAHDFRNLLTTIILYTEMVLRTPDLSPSSAPPLKTILEESHKATDLVQQILDFSSRAMIKRAPLDLATFTHDVIDVLQRAIPENIPLTLDIKTPASTTTVEADAGRLQQVLTNLALNARDAMPEGGDLRFTLSTLEIGPDEARPIAEMPPGLWVCLAVADTGTGMTEDIQAHLFEPFFTTKEVGEGTGLGLAQVYGIIRQHDGYIDVETVPDEGSTFYIYLPAGETIVLSQAEEQTTFPHGQGDLILVVEDEDFVRQALVDALEMLNYRALEAADGKEALHMLARHDVALVLSDVVMPNMGGAALFEALQQSDAPPPMIMLSGHPLEHKLRDLQTQGLTGWLPKPPDIDQLGEILARVLRGYQS